MLKLKQRGTFVMVAATLSMGGMMVTAQASTPPASDLIVVTHDSQSSNHNFITRQFQADLIVRQIGLTADVPSTPIIVAEPGADHGGD